MPRLRAAVIGVGYLGSLHAQKYPLLDDVELVAVADADPARAAEVAARSGCRAVADYRQILDDIDMASIVVPTERHHEVAKACIEAGVHILVEKPITQTLAEAEELVALAASRGRVFQVGHLERFNPAFLKARERVGEPLFIESHRLAPFKPRGTDVNVVLDLMIHDIDLILDLVKAEVTEVRAAGFPVLTREVDIGNARIEFANGCAANVTASRVSAKAMRKLRIFQHDAYVTVDTLEHRCEIMQKVGEGAAGMPAIDSEQHQFERPDPLLTEIRAFAAAVRAGTPPPVSGADGKRALAVALAITDLMNERMKGFA